ncbi:hypothetical protein H0H92_005875 [Tricholoma furcatifolium]|nr:hypothetical protein H0H92_005875 [Tricholoma furcatifolium]
MSYPPYGASGYTGAPPAPGVPIGLPPGGSGYGPPPVPGQPIGSSYQPSYASPRPQYYPPGPAQSYYPPPPGAPQTSYYPPPPGSAPQSSYYPPPGSYQPSYYPPPQTGPPPLPNFSSYPGAASHAGVQYYLGTPVPNVFALNELSVPGYDPFLDSENIRSATKGIGTNDNTLIRTLAPLSAMQMQALANKFMASYGKSLVSVLESETSFNFKFCIRAVAMGPLAWDIYLLRFAMHGAGTKESVLTELLIGRPMHEIRLLIQAYHHLEHRNLIDDVKGELSMKTERMFLMALNSDRPPDTTPVDYDRVARDVDALYNAGEKKIGTDELVFCDVFINRTQPHITAVSGHMKHALLHVYQGANPKHDRTGIYRDAKLIYKSMEGLGTQDNKLVWRVVRAHWDTPRFESIKVTYFQRRKETLDHRITKETSGSYRNLLLEIVKPGAGVKR